MSPWIRAMLLAGLTPCLQAWGAAEPSAIARPIDIQKMRVWRSPEATRVVFDLTAPLEYEFEVSSEPPRVTVRASAGRWVGRIPVFHRDPLLKAVRMAPEPSGGLKLVLDLHRPASPRAFVLGPAGPYGDRLVLDLSEVAAGAVPPAAGTPAAPPSPLWVVAIDAGHGGEDPGAIGRRHRTHEKVVTLAIARRLAHQVNATPGMRAVLIREGDYYVPLKDRVRRARKAQADVLISIHADAVDDHRARGASVYALSDRGASSVFARMLASRENNSDRIGGVSLADQDDMLARTLLDMTQTRTMEFSSHLAGDLLGALGGVSTLHGTDVEHAGFAVLKAPDVPSVLVETAFISNPAEERRLRDPAWQERVARAMLRGLKTFKSRPGTERLPPARPERAATDPRSHVVAVGETLDTIAARYGVNVALLRFSNHLPDGEPKVGTRIRLP